ncbi:hypothetical protein C8J56DRAFT_790633 [Mycena floridula]|nr:hypothetical protein C8J56DRAFT_790633 [Mycena floridula]
MGYVRTRTFCCCLPVRFGVFMLSIVGLVGGAMVAVTAWLQVMQLKAHPLAFQDELALWCHTVVYTLLALASLFGFIAAIVKNRRLIMAFWIILTGLLLISIGSGAYTLYSIFIRKSQQTIVNCLNGATDQLTNDVCRNGLAILKGVAVAIYVITWLLEIYAIIIISSYGKQLAEDNDAYNVSQLSTVAISQPEPLTMYNSFGAGGQNTGYAFSKVDNSKSQNGRGRRASLTSIV